MKPIDPNTAEFLQSHLGMIIANLSEPTRPMPVAKEGADPRHVEALQGALFLSLWLSKYGRNGGRPIGAKRMLFEAQVEVLRGRMSVAWLPWLGAGDQWRGTLERSLSVAIDPISALDAERITELSAETAGIMTSAEHGRRAARRRGSTLV